MVNDCPRNLPNLLASTFLIFWVFLLRAQPAQSFPLGQFSFNPRV